MTNRTGQRPRGARGAVCLLRRASIALAAWAAVCIAVGLSPIAASSPSQGAGGAVKVLSLQLPASGEVQVENLRGSVRIEVWDGEGVELTTDAAGPTRRASARPPVQIQRSESLLSIKVGRATVAGAGRVDLKLRIPAQAQLKVSTSEGEIEVRGVPAHLSAQTISGTLRLQAAPPQDASITAQSLNGSVSIGEGFESEGSAAHSLRQKFQARLGDASRTVNLFSGRGLISLETAPAAATPPTTAETDATTDAPIRAARAARTATRGRRGRAARNETQNRASRNTNGANGANGASGEARESGANGAGESVRGEAQGQPPRLSGRTNTDAASRTPSGASPSGATSEEVDEDDVVRVETELVTLNVSVVDRANGRGLVGLKREDFRLEEDGTEQQLEHFEASTAPFDLLLLIDLSGSTAKVTDLIRAAAARFVGAARSQDRIAIVTFAGTTNIVSPLTSDRAALRSSIGSMEPPKGDTRLYDAVAFAVDYLEKNAASTRRRAVVLMSDGLDSTLPNVTGVGSALSYTDLRGRVEEFDGVLYTIWTSTEYEAFSPDDIQPETFDLAHDRMQELAERGGGVFYDIERLEDLAGAYERVIADLGTVYSLSYRPTNKVRDGRWRNIRVRLPRHPEAVARGKRGYFAN